MQEYLSHMRLAEPDGLEVRQSYIGVASVELESSKNRKNKNERKQKGVLIIRNDHRQFIG